MFSKSVNFSIKSYYLLVDHGRLELLFGGCYLESMGSVSFFAWEVVLQETFSVEKSNRRGWTLVNGCSIRVWKNFLASSFFLVPELESHDRRYRC